MLLHIPEVLSRAEVAQFRQQLGEAPWQDGRATAGAQGAQVKRNLQVPPEHPVAKALGDRILQVLATHPQFISAALPKQTLRPLFNCYQDGGTYGYHVDSAVMQAPQGPRIRTDVSTTLFLSEPDEYEGGELTVTDTYGTHEVKLAAGDMIVYPSTSLHQVSPVTRGARISAFFWTQSMVRDDAQRSTLFELDQTIQRLRARLGDEPDVLSLTGHYHNLLRRWADL